MTFARSRQRRKRIGAPSYGAITARIAELLGPWCETDETQKRAVTLEHVYTQDGLTLDRLKGADRARAEVLFEAAEQAGCVAHLALLTLWQLGDVDHDYTDYSYRRRRYRSRYDDDGEDPGREYEMGEIIETSLTANHWSDRHGEARQFGEIRVDKAEVVAGDALDDGEPSEEEFEGYTGNAGLTLERWYHRAAVVIWPRARHFAVLCDAGTQAAIGGLEAMTKGLRRGAEQQREAARRDCPGFAGAIIDGWTPTHGTWFVSVRSSGGTRESENRGMAAASANQVSEHATLSRWPVDSTARPNAYPGSAAKTRRMHEASSPSSCAGWMIPG